MITPQDIPDQRHISFYSAGVRVTFPFEPYDIQREYVECVIKAARDKQNALLESPTGTGKTLSLLCSSLAWQQSQAPQSMIYYTSRTHLQLSQAAKEMKRTAYAGVPAVVIASRNHMCLNDEVKQHKDQFINRACHNAIAKKACVYHNNYEQRMEGLNVNQVHDIEDLHEFGLRSQCCPYYLSKKFAETKASIVFMPYNYLLDLSVSKSTQLKLDNSIVIFDEGHNLESALKDNASAHFTEQYLKDIEDSCDRLPSKLNDILNNERHGLTRLGYDPEKKRGGSGVVDEFAKPKNKTLKEAEKENKKNPVEELAEHLTGDNIRQVNRCVVSLMNCKSLMNSTRGHYEDTKCSIHSIFDRMKEAGVEFSTSDTIITTLDSMASFWSIAGVMNPATVARYIGALHCLSQFISLLYPQGCVSVMQKDKNIQCLKEFYAVHLKGIFEKQSVLLSSNKLINWQLDLWCLHPAIGYKRVMDNLCVIGPRSVVVTSGTLAPMRPIEQELEIDFKIVREFKHLISEEQLNVMILSDSPSRKSLLSTFQEAKRPEYPEALGQTLLTLFRTLPYGTLVFFPSYNLMNRAKSYWESKLPTTWREMQKASKIFIECKGQEQFCDDMINYKKLIDTGGRAVYMGVCRGKLSEGTNFQSNHCRSVIIVGLPFPSLHEPRVIETKEFHSRRGDEQGTHWYTQQMRRALSQAFGRVIRSKDDFGMLFLCDPRFTRYKFSLSEWIKPFYPVDSKNDYKAVCEEIKRFFLSHNIDISTMITVSDSSLANSQNNIFELDQATRRAPKKSTTKDDGIEAEVVEPVKGSKAAFRVRGIASLGMTADKSPKSRRAEMVASYTVDRETLDRVRSARASQVEKATVDSSEQPSSAKRPKTTADIFEAVFESNQPNEQSSTSAKNATKSSVPLVTLNSDKEDTIEAPKESSQQQLANKKTTGPQCYVCRNTARRPHVINCACARIGCISCLTGLNKKDCGDCGAKLKLRLFKPILFNVFRKRDT